MPTYAVKIGEIHLRSEEPITPEQRKEVIAQIQKDGGALVDLYVSGDIEFKPDRTA